MLIMPRSMSRPTTFMEMLAVAVRISFARSLSKLPFLKPMGGKIAYLSPVYGVPPLALVKVETVPVEL